MNAESAMGKTPRSGFGVLASALSWREHFSAGDLNKDGMNGAQSFGEAALDAGKNLLRSFNSFD